MKMISQYPLPSPCSCLVEGSYSSIDGYIYIYIWLWDPRCQPHHVTRKCQIIPTPYAHSDHWVSPIPLHLSFSFLWFLLYLKVEVEIKFLYGDKYEKIYKNWFNREPDNFLRVIFLKRKSSWIFKNKFSKIS